MKPDLCSYPSASGGPAQYNGNISETIWKNADGRRQSYGYSYDKMNRLTAANYYNPMTPAENGRFDEWIGNTTRTGYDLNGNLLNLFRNGKTAEGIFGLMDDLTYSYSNGGNQLSSVADAISTSTSEIGFKEAQEGAVDYSYDATGNMTSDVNKGITEITYNHLNLPEKVSKSPSEYHIYTYDATGRKVAQEVFGSQAKRTEYIGELVYENDVLQFVSHNEGRAVMTGVAPVYQYHLRDHLGNIRTTFTTTTDVDNAAGNDGERQCRYRSKSVSLL